ncbi:MAG: MutS family DNA mismatch repair protein [Candidatus Promineifilaceae bacterium]|nr:MutS family DNA mismatch repair protein [Candidatus Promineifilaceae bacterium]
MTQNQRSNRLNAINRQIDRLDRRLEDMKRRASRLSNWRLGIFATIFMFGAFVFFIWGALPWAIASVILLIPFVITVYWHRKIEYAIKRHYILLALKQAQAARMLLDWEKIPLAESIVVTKDHPFAADLDLIGERSILRLIDVSITKEGSQQLCDWLLETEPNPELTIQRQAIVKELIRLPALRDRLILNALMTSPRVNWEGSSTGSTDAAQRLNRPKWSGTVLIRWLEDQKIDAKSLWTVLVLLSLMVPLNFALLVGFISGALPPLWIVSWLVYAAIMLSQSRKVEPIFRDAAYLNDLLRQLSAVFSSLEQRPFTQSPALRDMFSPLRVPGHRPSQQLKRANGLLSAAGLRINPFVGLVLNAVAPWDIFIAHRLISFKQELVSLVPEWLDIWYRLEALNGLANIGVLYPHATFAIFKEIGADLNRCNSNGSDRGECSQPPFEAKNLGHPLIAEETRVYNDITIDQLGSVLIITGSNMSGKSTFLRSLGVNVCLAQAGAPSVAQSLSFIPLRVATSITVADSLMDGFSFFYAEVRRLKALLEMLHYPHTYPLLFLIDEIFRGTNNRERLIGSKAYVETLTGGFGLGAIATHDLELVNLAQSTECINNAHFRDDIEDGRMVFDYKLRPGPCPTTNALRIMRLAGLPMSEDLEAKSD